MLVGSTAYVPLATVVSGDVILEATRNGTTVSRAVTVSTRLVPGPHSPTTTWAAFGPQPQTPSICPDVSNPLCWQPAQQIGTWTPYVKYSPGSSPEAAVFIMHGNNTITLCDEPGQGFHPTIPSPDGQVLDQQHQDCFAAYADLGLTLARQGMNVYSMAVTPTGLEGSGLTGRAQFLAAFVQRIFEFEGLDPDLPVILVGHSVGGDAAVDATPVLQGLGRDIAGIVGMAPAGNWNSDHTTLITTQFAASILATNSDAGLLAAFNGRAFPAGTHG